MCNSPMKWEWKLGALGNQDPVQGQSGCQRQSEDRDRVGGAAVCAVTNYTASSAKTGNAFSWKKKYKDEPSHKGKIHQALPRGFLEEEARTDGRGVRAGEPLRGTAWYHGDSRECSGFSGSSPSPGCEILPQPLPQLQPQGPPV